METKPWYLSTTIWFNILAVIAGILAIPEFLEVIPSSWMPIIATIAAVVNFLLRFKTIQPVGK